MTTQSLSFGCAATPISSKVFGPFPGGRAAAGAAAAAGFGLAAPGVGFVDETGATSFFGGFGTSAVGGRVDPGLDEGAEVTWPGCAGC